MDKKIDAFFSPLFFLGRWRWKETISLTFKLPRALRGLPFHTRSCLILPANTMLSSNIWENSGQEKNFFFLFFSFPFNGYWSLCPLGESVTMSLTATHLPPLTQSVAARDIVQHPKPSQALRLREGGREDRTLFNLIKQNTIECRHDDTIKLKVD